MRYPYFIILSGHFFLTFCDKPKTCLSIIFPLDQVCSGIKQLSMCTQNVNIGLTTLKIEGSIRYMKCCQTIFPRKEEAQYHHCQLQLPSPKRKKLPKFCVDSNLQMLLMTDHFKRQENTNQKQEIEI
jgi:hypothetical protein